MNYKDIDNWSISYLNPDYIDSNFLLESIIEKYGWTFKISEFKLEIPDFYYDNDTLCVILSKFHTFGNPTSDSIICFDSCSIVFENNKKELLKFGDIILCEWHWNQNENRHIPKALSTPIRIADFDNDELNDLRIEFISEGRKKIFYVFQKSKKNLVFIKKEIFNKE
ncbi:MAG: hypothetical protein WCK02_05050 [Bacteroidota bacterium]